MPHNDESDVSGVGQRRIYDVLEAARRRRSDQELTAAALIGEAFAALPAAAELDAVRAAARDVLGDDRPRERPQRSRTAVTDGGRYILPGVGDRVEDRDSDEGDELIVLETHPDTAAHDAKIEALDGLTVAEVNEEYDAAAPVVEVVYVDEADAALDRWRGVEDLRDAVHYNAVIAYSFPADRLAPVSGGEAR